LFLPSMDSQHPAKCTYLGLVMLGLIGLGLFKNRRGTGWMLALAAPFLLLALGPWPTLGGKALGFAGPAYGLVQLFPSLSGMTHWERAVGAAIPFLAVAAALGAVHLPRKRGVLVFVTVLLLVDSLAFSNVAWPRASYALQAPAALQDLAGEGGLIQLPFDNGRVEFSEDPARIYTRWQLAHQRPISENYEGVDSALEQSTLLSVADALCGLPQTIPPYYQVPLNLRPSEAPQGLDLDAERELLRSWGYRWIILHRDRCPRVAPVIQLLDDRLGDGDRVDEQTLAWEL
jgi:hypothetical protein